MSTWSTKSEILFTTGNSLAVLKNLTDAAKRLEAVVKAVTTATTNASASFDLMGAAAAKAAASVDLLAEASRRTAATTSGASSGAARTAKSYDGVAVAANAAAASVLRFQAASKLPAIAPSARQLALDSTAQALPSVAANAAILAPPPRNVTPRWAMPPSGGGFGSTGGGAGGFGGGVPGGPGGPGAGGTGGGGGGGNIPGIAAASVPGFMASQAKKAAKWAAVATGGFLIDSIYEAGKLQSRLTTIRTASPGLFGDTPGNTAVMDRVKAEAFKISGDTAQSVVQSANILATIAKSGIDAQTMLQRDKQGESFAELIAKYADVQYLSRGVSFEGATKDAVKIAHMMGAYTPQAIKPIVDETTKLSFMMPDRVDKLVTQAGYFAKLYGRFGVPKDQTLMLGAWLDRMGSNSKGGTWLANLLLNAQGAAAVTGHLQGARASAMKHFGLVGKDGKLDPTIFSNDKNGKLQTSMFDEYGRGLLQRFNDVIQRDRAGKVPAAAAAAERSDILQFQKAFGMQGQRIPLLADQQGVDVLLGMVKALKVMPTTDQAQSAYMKTLPGASQQAWTNFQNVATRVGYEMLPGLTLGMTKLANSLSAAGVWLDKHKALEKRISKWVTDTVNATSGFLTKHHSELVGMGHDLAQIGKTFSDSGPILLTIADDALKFAHAISATAALISRPIDAFLQFENKLLGKGATPMPTVGPRMSDFQIVHDGIAKYLSRPAPPAAPGIGHTGRFAENRDHRERMREVSQTHIHGNVIVQVPPGSTDPKRMALEARKAFEQMMRHPRSGMAATGGTHPDIPLALTIGPRGR